MSIHTTLTSGDLDDIMTRLAPANDELTRRVPGDSGDRQPVHAVYGGAHLFRHDTAARLGRLALAAVDTYAPDTVAFAGAVGLTGDELASEVFARMYRKLEVEPVEDFRIDFEDGYGHRGDDEEDASAAAAAVETATGLENGTLPPFIGIRVKPCSRELAPRALRTIDIYLTTLLGRTGGVLPAGFVITLPKVMIAEQVTAAVEALDRLEQENGLAPGAVRIELMVETPQSIIDHTGRCPLPAFIAAGRGRCVAAHFGVYDYTASSNVTAHHQTMEHPVCDFAREVMQVSLAGTGITLSDGATNILPVAPHRASTGGPPLTSPQEEENREVVHHAWRLHYDDVRRSLIRGYYQGWDLNPAQLPTRYAAVYAFFLESLASATQRLRNFVDQAAQATLVGSVFDDAATGQGLLNYFLRALNCGAITEEEATATGLSVEELRMRSFAEILEGRRG